MERYRQAMEAPKRKVENNETLYSLLSLSARLGIDYPTLRQYAEEHADRIPTQGRKRQRFPEAAIAVLEEIHRERSGRSGAKATAAKKQAASGPARPTTRRIRRRKDSEVGGASDREALLAAKLSERRAAGRRAAVQAARAAANEAARKEGKGRNTGARRPAQSREGETDESAPGGPRPTLAPRLNALEASQKRLEEEIRSHLELLRSPLSGVAEE
ncbi:MAG: hypothetical protein AAF481_18905 [Acidobacteriota bacterium]